LRARICGTESALDDTEAQLEPEALQEYRHRQVVEQGAANADLYTRDHKAFMERQKEELEAKKEGFEAELADAPPDPPEPDSPYAQAILGGRERLEEDFHSVNLSLDDVYGGLEKEFQGILDEAAKDPQAERARNDDEEIEEEATEL